MKKVSAVETLSSNHALIAELKRTGISVKDLAERANCTENTIYRAKRSIRSETRPLLLAILTAQPDKPVRDHEALRAALVATGLPPAQIRTCSGTALASVNKLLAGKQPSAVVFDRLKLWIDRGAPGSKHIPANPNTKPIKSSRPSDPGIGFDRALDIIEGRAGLFPELSLGAGYLASSRPPTSVHFNIPNRNKAGYVGRQILNGAIDVDA